MKTMPPEMTPAATVTTTPAATPTETVVTPTTPAPTETTVTPPTEPTKPTETPTEPAKPAVEPAKVETEKPAEPVKEEPAKTEPAKAEPPKYELKASEGSLLTKEQVAEIESIAKAGNLTEEQAKKVLTTQEAAVKAYNDKLVADFKNDSLKWVEDIKSDKVLGGENFGRTLELNKKVTDFFGDDQFRTELAQSGFGNHPGLVRMLAKIGEAMGENSAFIKPTTTSQAQPKRAADILFGGSSQK